MNSCRGFFFLKFLKCEPSNTVCSLLSLLCRVVLCCAVQAAVSPLRAMQDKAYSMLSSRAYVHQYAAYGMQQADFQQCFAVVEDVLAAYGALQSVARCPRERPSPEFRCRV